MSEHKTAIALSVDISGDAPAIGCHQVGCGLRAETNDGAEGRECNGGYCDKSLHINHTASHILLRVEC
jgi:hypothetical protein